MIEYSEDGVNWVKYQTDRSAYERTIDNFRSDWSKANIQATITKLGNTRIEYSQDGGYSWVPFRFSQSLEENAARIFTMLQRNYEVRSLKIKQIGTVQVTTNTSSSGSFFRSANIAMSSSGQTKPAKISYHDVYVYRGVGGAYYFSDVEPKTMLAARSSDLLIVKINQTTVYSMEAPNFNGEWFSPDGDKRNKAQLRVRGFVFRFLHPDDVPSIFHWWDVLKQSNPAININDYIVVKSARLYDREMDQFFEGLGPICAVMGTQYILGWKNRYKFGDTWLMPADAYDNLEKRLRAKGAFVETMPQPTNVENKKEVSFTPAEVNPAYIMQIRENFREIVRIGTDQQIMDNLLKVVDFRNKCVDELKELNKVIEEARDKVKEHIGNG
jgi:hypothetical protein